MQSRTDIPSADRFSRWKLSRPLLYSAVRFEWIRPFPFPPLALPLLYSFYFAPTEPNGKSDSCLIIRLSLSHFQARARALYYPAGVDNCAAPLVLRLDDVLLHVGDLLLRVEVRFRGDDPGVRVLALSPAGSADERLRAIRLDELLDYLQL